MAASGLSLTLLNDDTSTSKKSFIVFMIKIKNDNNRDQSRFSEETK